MRRECRSLSWVARVLAAACLATVAHATQAQSVSTAEVEILRTTDGIPHIRATRWQDLGMGIGFVQAQDALCTLAEAFVTYEGRRSWFFGADQRPAIGSGLGKSKNIDSDFFFKAFADEAMVERFRREQPEHLDALVAGFAKGFNRHLREVVDNPLRRDAPACALAPWLREISAQDIYRRMYAALMMGGYLQFLPDIVNATPGSKRTVGADEARELQARLAHNIGEQSELGSNAIAWGGQATGGDGALLFGNPHWFWGGPDRFYQMHLQIPGLLDVAGAGFLGVPMVVIGFNEQVAWSHTVSSARRFGLFQLHLDPADPTRYVVDGVSEPMQKREIHIAVRGQGGDIQLVSRVLHSSRFGPVVDLSGLDGALGWSSHMALAVRDVNADNWRAYRNFLAWNSASSLDEFIAIQRREAAMPWVNTIAIGRGDERVWYADIGSVPNVSDAFRKDCGAPLSAAFARFDARTPLLDGRRSDCNWPVDPEAAQPGAMAAGNLPGLLRQDYVANMNDSHWLANAAEPLEGFAAVLGEERTVLGLRGRLGHQIAQQLLQRGATSAGELGVWAQRDVLDARSYSAQQFRASLLDQLCLAEAGDTAGDLSLGSACTILRAWGGTALADDRGALLWDAFWSELEKLPEDQLYRIGFSHTAPMTTPSAPMPGRELLAQALKAAQQSLTDRGIAPDEAPGRRRYALSEGRRIPIPGGCGAYFTAACPADQDYVMGPNAIANSYLQLVWFSSVGVEARTLLAHGQDERAVSGGPGAAPVARYARGQWLQFPFRDADIRRDPQLHRTVLRP